MAFDLDKYRSIGVMTKAGSSRTTTEREESATVTTTEHWDGRQDATITPDTVRFAGRVHGQGKKEGQVAEITRKDR